jgi:uncharacterized protein
MANITLSSRAALWAALVCVAVLVTWAWLSGEPPENPPPTLGAQRAAPGDQLESQKPDAARETLVIETKAGAKTFSIEVARTAEQQALGLMFRTSLPETQGMLFPHDDSREVTMWMRNTYIPLDMVFIRADGIVHRVEANTEPMSERIIPSNGPVAGVLELAGGAASRLGIAPGDQVRHTLFKTSPQP